MADPKVVLADPKTPPIVALDFETCDEALAMATLLKGKVDIVKVGLRLAFKRDIYNLIDGIRALGLKVFFDAKLYDIGSTVEAAVKEIVKDIEPNILTVKGYPDTIKAAVQGAAGSATEIFPISVLTSWIEEMLKDAGYTTSIKAVVGQRVDSVVIYGAHGLVCSVAEAQKAKNFARQTIKIITPGIRLESDARGDQKRVDTPREAIRAGADYYVVGRPIIRADDPLAAVDRFIENAALAAQKSA